MSQLLLHREFRKRCVAGTIHPVRTFLQHNPDFGVDTVLLEGHQSEEFEAIPPQRRGLFLAALNGR